MPGRRPKLAIREVETAFFRQNHFHRSGGRMVAGLFPEIKDKPTAPSVLGMPVIQLGCGRMIDNEINNADSERAT